MIGSLLGLSLLATLSPSPQNAPQATTSQVTAWPAGGLLGLRRSFDPPPTWSLLDLHPDGREASFPMLEQDEDLEPVLDPEMLVDLLRQAHPELDDMPDFGLDLTAGQLVITGDGRKARSVIATAERLAAVLARPIALHATLYDWADRAPPPAAVDARGLAAATDGFQPVWRAQARSRSSVKVQLAQIQWTRYLREAEVEIASRASIAAPEVAAMFEGIQVLVEPHALASSDDIALLCQFAIGARVGPRARTETGIDDLPVFDAPAVAIDTGGISGRVRDGGALLATFASDGDAGRSWLLAVSAQWAAPRGDAPARAYVAPVSVLASGSMRAFPPPVYPFADDSDPDYEHVLYRSQDHDDEPEPLLDVDRLQDLLRQSVTPDAWDDTASMSYAGGHIHVRGPQETIDGVDKLLLQLQNQWLQNTEVRLRTELLETTGSGPFAVPTPGAEPLLLHQAVLPTLRGRVSLLVHGIERANMRTMEVEVAEKSSIYSPQVQNLFSGICAATRPEASRAGLAARLEVDLAQVLRIEPRPMGNTQGGTLSLPTTGTAHFDHDGALPEQGPLILGLGPVLLRDGKTWRIRQAVEMVKR